MRMEVYQEMSKMIFGIDVGGTFTDIVVIANGKLAIHKLSSPPSDPSSGVIQGVSEISNGLKPDPYYSDESIQFVHGSTVATNALLEGKGSKTALKNKRELKEVNNYELSLKN